MARYTIRLYVAGKNPRSVEAICFVEGLVDLKSPAGYVVEVVDLLEDSAHGVVRAIEDGVVATPTVVKSDPPPRRQMVLAIPLPSPEHALYVLGIPHDGSCGSPLSRRP